MSSRFRSDLTGYLCLAGRFCTPEQVEKVRLAGQEVNARHTALLASIEARASCHGAFKKAEEKRNETEQECDNCESAFRVATTDFHHQVVLALLSSSERLADKGPLCAALLASAAGLPTEDIATRAAKTKAPEAETKAPESKPKAPKPKAPEPKAPDAPETKAPEPKALDTKVPETKALVDAANALEEAKALVKAAKAAAKEATRAATKEAAKETTKEAIKEATKEADVVSVEEAQAKLHAEANAARREADRARREAERKNLPKCTGVTNKKAPCPYYAQAGQTTCKLHEKKPGDTDSSSDTSSHNGGSTLRLSCASDSTSDTDSESECYTGLHIGEKKAKKVEFDDDIGEKKAKKVKFTVLDDDN